MTTSVTCKAQIQIKEAAYSAYNNDVFNYTNDQ